MNDYTPAPVIAQFEKVSYERFAADIHKSFPDQYYSDAHIRSMYDSIILPSRSTKGSAGYDFYSPINTTANSLHPVLIPTGIRCAIADGWFLALYPRSGIGFKYGVGLMNTVGIIDSDYYFAENEGHIMVKLSSHYDQYYLWDIAAGDKFCQGIFQPYGITFDDNAENIRIGGMGSTGR